VLPDGSLELRTYERGVEDETLACGTGVVASALIHHLLHNAPSPVTVKVRGGDTLSVAFVREAEMCGNGARCFGQFIRHQIHGGDLTSATFETIAGLVSVQFPGNEVQIGLSTPHSLQLGKVIDVDGQPLTVHSVNTGVPHAVIPVEDLEAAEVFRIGRIVRHHEAFAPKGTNVNFMKVLAPGSISIRTYERGVEDETLACGTGMVACAIVHHELSGAPAPVAVRVRGGDTLRVDFTRKGDGYDDVRLTGPADFVFRGTLALD
jgi:diaminopimelate epimerase